MESYEQLIQQQGKVPVLLEAKIICFQETLFIKVVYCVCDYEGDRPCKRSYEATYQLLQDGAETKVRLVGFPCEIDEKKQKLKSYAPSRRLFASGTSLQVDNRTFPVLEIYARDVKVFEKRMDTMHEFFGNTDWDEELELFVYQAEGKRGKCCPMNPETYVYRQSWGEKLAETVDPRLFICIIDSEEVAEICVPEHIAASCILSNGDVAFIGYKTSPVKFGMTYCFNRPSGLFVFRYASSTVEELVSCGSSTTMRSLHKSTADRLFFLRSRLGESHFGASELCYYDFAEAKIVEAADGLFCEKIDRVDAGGCVFLTTIRGSRRTVSIFSEGRLQDLDKEYSDETCSYTFLDCLNSHVVVKKSAPNKFPCLVLGTKSLGKFELCEIGLPAMNAQCAKVCKALSEVRYKSVKLGDASDIVLIFPPNPNRHLVLVPHGGPNSIYTTEYSLYSSCLALAGYMVVAVNYTGSVGFSAEAIEKLEGNIGVLDVEDMIKALEMVKELVPGLEGVFLMGGSHGGFICATLTCKYPNIFRGCVLRNPVVDLPSMSYSTDIIDWTFGQMGMIYDLHRPRPATLEELSLKFLASPSSLLTCSGGETPTLVLVGSKDLRVAPFQGRSWHYWLQAKGVKTELMEFPDADHSLTTPVSEYNSLLAILRFFQGLH